MHKYFILLLWMPCCAWGQLVSGYYTNVLRQENGVPLAGATVTNLSTHTGSLTDKNGYFKIYATEGNTIQVASVGYRGSQIKVTAAMLQTGSLILQKPVEPVLSGDYAALIHQGPIDRGARLADSIAVPQNRTLQLTGGFYAYLPVQEIHVRHNKLQISPDVGNQLLLSGNYSATVEMRNVNHSPVLQTQYAQGRPLNGALAWRGAETGEPFSFGPAIQALEFNGSAYNYDHNGRLVAAGAGNGTPATAYHNSIFHTALVASQSIQLTGRLIASHKQVFHFKTTFGQTDQNTVIRQHKNSGKNFSAAIGATLKQLMITVNYFYVQDRFSNSNRNGFLNRVYQNAMLTPASFENAQGYYLANGQRSYSRQADNPYFLLNDNGNSYRQIQQVYGLVLERKRENWNLQLTQSYERLQQTSNEVYKPATAYFENGISTQRMQTDKKYVAGANAIYTIPFHTYHLHAEAAANYHLHAENTNIHYHFPSTNYEYQRLNQDASINGKGSYRNNNFEAGLEAGSSLYASNTATRLKAFLPSAAAHISVANVLDVFRIRLSSSFRSSNTELPISQSLAYTNLLQYSTEQSLQYFPVQEVSGYKNLVPVQHKYRSEIVEINYKYKLTLTAEAFTKETLNDVFPIYENGKLNLRNVAGHRNKGFEVGLTVNDNYGYRKKIRTSHSLSFTTYRSRVTTVENGYDNLPIAGFSNVYKAVVKGQPLGVIMGNTYLRDATNNKVIGADGFPLVNAHPQVIGNPNPDFVMKLNNHLQWKNLMLHIDWEWKKGGGTWNGTQATLDYFGRSENTAKWRNTTGYIFPGVMQNGQKNQIPVNFINVNEPVENNRWTRYGYSGIAEAYIEKADYLKINSATLTYKFSFRKYLQSIILSAYVHNIMLWTAYSGADPGQLLYDHPNGDGLDFFNLPSTKTIGINASIQF